MPLITLDGTDLHYERRGRGPAMMLIHGLGGPAMWERIAPLLAAAGDVVVPHLPGFGESPASRETLAADDHARVLGRLLDALGVGDVTLAGISYGGEIAALLAAARPEKVTSLVLVCPTGAQRRSALARSPITRSLLRLALPVLLSSQRIADKISRRSFFDPDARPDDIVERYLRDLKRPGRAGSLAAAVDDIVSRGQRLPEIVAEIRCSVSLVWGRDDRIVPVTVAGAITELRPDLAPVILSRCGHALPLEQPAELSAIIAGIIKNGPAEAI